MVLIFCFLECITGVLLKSLDLSLAISHRSPLALFVQITNIFSFVIHIFTHLSATFDSRAGYADLNDRNYSLSNEFCRSSTYCKLA